MHPPPQACERIAVQLRRALRRNLERTSDGAQGSPAIVVLEYDFALTHRQPRDEPGKSRAPLAILGDPSGIAFPIQCDVLALGQRRIERERLSPVRSR